MPEYAYKLTDAEGRTRNDTCWLQEDGSLPGPWHAAPGEGALCTDGWLHFYGDALVAVLMNPGHAQHDEGSMRLFRCETAGARLDAADGKHGRARARAVEELPVPAVPLAARIRCAIQALLDVYGEQNLQPTWVEWARGWLDGTDRSAEAAAWAAACTAEAACSPRTAAACSPRTAAAWTAEAAWAAWTAAAAWSWSAAGAAAGAADEAPLPLDLAARLRDAIAQETTHV